jgi:hypothetical protein
LQFYSQRPLETKQAPTKSGAYFSVFGDPEMVLQRICPALVGAALVLAGSAAIAAEYRPDEFLGLDLSKAVLSPKPLGPPSEFAPVPVEANADAATKVDIAKTEGAKLDITKSDVAKPDVTKPHIASADHATAVGRSHVASRHTLRSGTDVAHIRTEKPRGAARTLLVHRHGSPLDSQALDTRIQTWPCNSGGICNWKQ